jgi:hypothetical protein
MKNYVQTDPLERWYIRRAKRNAKLGVIVRCFRHDLRTRLDSETADTLKGVRYE